MVSRTRKLKTEYQDRDVRSLRPKMLQYPNVPGSSVVQASHVSVLNVLLGINTRRIAALFRQSLLEEFFFVIGWKEFWKVANLLVLWEGAIHTGPVARGILETMLHGTVVITKFGGG
jgi:hypothetical protein